MEFEWDEEKAEANRVKHGISIYDAAKVLEDPMSFEDIDDRFDCGEDRIIATGLVQGIVLKVAYTMRGEVCRVIPARRATKHEEQDYFSEIRTRWALD